MDRCCFCLHEDLGGSVCFNNNILSVVFDVTGRDAVC